MSSFRTHFFTQLLNTDNHENLVKIIKTTYLRNENRINNKKKISDKDDQYFNLAEKYLYNKLSISLNETIERKTVKMCKHCGKPFSSENLKAEYCSPQCRNQANVYKSRAKNK